MTSPREDPDHVLHAWHDAVNTGDAEAALACCAEDVAVAGPRGTGHGHDLMRRWLERSGIRLVPQEDLIERGGRYVVRELARWTAAEAPDGAPRTDGDLVRLHGLGGFAERRRAVRVP